MEIEYFQVLEDGKPLHTYAELHLMAISYLADTARRALQGTSPNGRGSWDVTRVFTEEQARRIIADHLGKCARHAIRFPEPTRTFLVVEGEREIGIVIGLYEAAMLWNENPNARSVYGVAPIDGSGAETWKRVRNVTADELQGELSSVKGDHP